MSTAKPRPRDKPTADRLRRSAPVAAPPACASLRCRHRRPSQRPASSAARLCPHCLSRLGSDLRALADAYRESDHALTPAAVRPRIRVSGTLPAKGIVLDEKTVALRARVTRTLASWARLVVDEARSSTPDRCEVPSLVRFLTLHVTWLARHPAAADFDSEISQLLESCRTVLGPGETRRTPLGACPEAGCDDVLAVVTHPGSGQATRQVACESGHELPPHEWLRFLGGGPHAPFSHSGSLPPAPEGVLS